MQKVEHVSFFSKNTTQTKLFLFDLWFCLICWKRRWVLWTTTWPIRRVPTPPTRRLSSSAHCNCQRRRLCSPRRQTTIWLPLRQTVARSERNRSVASSARRCARAAVPWRSREIWYRFLALAVLFVFCADNLMQTSICCRNCGFANHVRLCASPPLKEARQWQLLLQHSASVHQKSL